MIEDPVLRTNIDRLKTIHYDIKALLVAQDFDGAAQYMNQFNVEEDFDIGASRTCLIVTKCFNDLPLDGKIDSILKVREELYKKHCKALNVEFLH